MAAGFVLATVDVSAALAAGNNLSDTLLRGPDASYEEFLSGFRLSPKVPCASTADCPGNATCQMGAPNFGGPRHCGGRGRPVDVEVMPDGSILLSDDMNGLIYRVQYIGTPPVSGASTGLAALPLRTLTWRTWLLVALASAAALARHATYPNPLQ